MKINFTPTLLLLLPLFLPGCSADNSQEGVPQQFDYTGYESRSGSRSEAVADIDRQGSSTAGAYLSRKPSS